MTPELLDPLLSSVSTSLVMLVLGSTRFAMACLVLPLFPADLVPTMSRNSLFVLFGVIALAMQPTLEVGQVSLMVWAGLFGKEAIFGAALGLMFGGILWAFEAAGQIIDTKAGATGAQVNDPMSGQQTSLNGEFFSKLAGFVFMYSGGLLLLAGLVIQTYAIWPLFSLVPTNHNAALHLFESEFGHIFVMAVLIAGPVLVVLFTVDFALGLVNRFAPQLNLFSLAMSAKIWIATLIILVMLTSLVDQMLHEIMSREPITMKALRAVFGPGLQR